jgi:RNA polymerase sigma factor (sigma-70 family)
VTDRASELVDPGLVPASRLARLSLRVQRDERLTELARLGSEAAFEAIVHRYRGALVRHCAALVGQADADEAVQDALIKAHQALARGAMVHSLGAWLYAIAHNSALSLLRRRRAGAQYREDLDARHEGMVASREQLDALVSAFLTLPVRQRRALVMRELEGRSYEEIGARLGASNGAVRALLNRARASVRDRLGALIPVELALRWLSVAAGSGPSRAVTLAGTGALGAKISSVILMSAAPVVAVAPVTMPAPAGARTAGRAPIAYVRSRPKAPAPRVHLRSATTPRGSAPPPARAAAISAPACSRASKAPRRSARASAGPSVRMTPHSPSRAAFARLWPPQATHRKSVVFASQTPPGDEPSRSGLWR